MVAHALWKKTVAQDVCKSSVVLDEVVESAQLRTQRLGSVLARHVLRLCCKCISALSRDLHKNAMDDAFCVNPVYMRHYSPVGTARGQSVVAFLRRFGCSAKRHASLAVSC